MGQTTLTWDYDGVDPQNFAIYRSATPMDPEALPTALDTVTGDLRQYVDTTVVEDATYYYRVAAVQGSSYKVSEELEHTASASADEYFPAVVSLLHFDGADASTTFTDEKGKTWTATGNTQIDTAQFLFGSSSALFDGTGTISTANHADFDFGNGDFTVELWVRPANVTGFKNLVRKGVSSDYAPFTIALDGNKVRSRCSEAGTAWNMDQTSTEVVTAGAWNHIALVRRGSTITQYVNGVASGSTTTNNSLMTNTAGVYLGAQSDNGSPYAGHMAEVRITKGVGRYAANFTPPDARFSDTGAVVPEALSLYNKLLRWWELDAQNYMTGDYGKDSLSGSTSSKRLGHRAARTAATLLSTNGGTLFNTGQQYTREESTDFRGIGDIAVRTALKAGPSNAIERVITLHGLNPNPEGASGNSANNIGFKFYVDTDGVPKVRWQYGTNTWETAVAAGAALGAVGTIYWLGFDRDTTGGTVTHVRNGTRESSQAYANAPSGGAGTDTYLFAGGVPNGSFSGTKQVDSLQRLCIFDAPLTANEDTYLWNGGTVKRFGELKANAGF